MKPTKDKVTCSHLVQRVYNSGMQLADALRLLGKHKESGQIEVWVLQITNEMRKGKQAP